MYGYVITEKGLELDAKLRAGSQLKLTRAMVGDGTVPEDTNPRKLTDLVSPFAEATSTEPTAVGASNTLVLEYRNDMNGGLDRNRYINEYGLFAEDPDDGEILYLYGNLGEFREPVRAYRANEPTVTRRYPISITVSDGVDVALGYLPSVFMTAAEAEALVEAHNKNTQAHQDLREELSGLRSALDASAGGVAAKITFKEGSAGWNYKITDGADETYTGIVPESLVVEVVLRKCSTVYTVTAWPGDDEQAGWSNQVTTGEYFGSVESEVTDFAATLTVTTAPYAIVTAVCGEQSYTAQAGGEGSAVLKIGVAGRYNVTAELDGKVVSGYAVISESQDYSLSLTDFHVDVNASPMAQGYITFEPEDWDENELRVAPEVHGLAPTSTACVCSIRQRIGRNVREISEGDAEIVAGAIIDVMKDALDANKTTPNTYPTAVDGHVQLTWEQVQYWLLEDILAADSEAKRQAQALGFNWQNRDTTGVPQTTTLDELLTAAYLPAMGSPDTNFKALCTVEVLQGLRLRIAASGSGYVTVDDQGHASSNGHGYAAKYDMDGILKVTWGTMATQTYMDTDTKELVLQARAPYAGDVLVVGSSGTESRRYTVNSQRTVLTGQNITLTDQIDNKTYSIIVEGGRLALEEI